MSATGHSGGTPRASASPAGTGSRSRTMMVGGLALGLTTAALAGMPAQAIDSNPPSGPGNIEVFPKRDMVAIEGYSEFAGKKAEIKVLRGGTVVGSAVGTVDATGFLEVNHPGGVCWGAGTDLKVTPDIRGNDEIRVDFLTTGHWDGSITQPVEVTDVVRDDAGLKLVVKGEFKAGVVPPGADPVAQPGRLGVEIVNPDMRDATSAIGERAIGWPADEVPTGYTVTGSTTGTAATGGTFTVTYGFETAEDLDLAEAGEVVALAWQADSPDPDVEAPAGMTLYEFHESSGPGFGGCPAGPDEMRPNSPGTYSAKGGEGSIDVSWAAATTAPSAPAVTGYTVRAVNGETEVGKRLDAGARSTTITGLTAGAYYDVEIAARSNAGESWTPSTMRIKASPHVVPAAEANTTAVAEGGKYQPLVGDLGVHLDPLPGITGAEVHYTTNGSTPTLTSPTFVSGQDSPLQILQDTTVRWVVVDSGNVVGPLGQKVFDIVESAAQPPATIRGVAQDSAIDVTFGAVAGADAYRLQMLDAAGEVRLGAPIDVPVPAGSPSEITHRVTGLTNGTAYTFTAAARVAGSWTADSPLSTPVAPVPAPKAVAGPAQTVLRNRVVTLDGSASVGAVKYLWTQDRPAGTTGAPQDPAVNLAGADTAKPTFTFPLLAGPTTDHTLQFTLTTTLADGTTLTSSTTVTGKADTVLATEARWRAGNPLRMSGTGSQNGAVLTFRDGSATGTVIGRATVANGAWTAPAVTVNLSNGRIHVTSDHGFLGTIQTTR